ncbi:MAG: hypothetical protein IKL82_05260 [Clostridia bacterium]|nr:hypothetical protein [Clostridia bacterium]
MAYFDFRKKLVDFHPKNIRKDISALDGEVQIPNLVTLIKSDDVVINNAIKDLKKFFKVSLDVTCEIDLTGAGFKIESKINPLQAKRSYTITASSDGIVILGDTNRSVAQGIYYFEFLLTEKKAPIIQKGSITVNLPFTPRMVHSGYGFDLFPNEYLSNIAHHGYDAILLYTNGVNSSPAGYLDFNDIVDRASEYGLDVYVYAAFGRYIDVYAENAEKEFDETYGAVFASCPRLKGITLVGESVEFASRDERVLHHSREQKPADNLPEGLPTPGWYPCRDYPIWINFVKNSIRKHNPDADVVFWSYNWGWAPEKDRVELVNTIPTDVTLLVTFEMFQHYNMLGSDQTVTDYTIAKTNAGPYFISEAKVAKERGLKLYAMVNTGGRTWDIGTCPYFPMPNQWIERYKAINEAKNLYGLCGLMESHHYGLFPSFISKLAQLCYTFDNSYEKNLKRVYNAYFDNSSQEIIDAFEDISKSISYMPPSIEEQYGPFRIGTAFPLCLISSVKPPKQPDAVYGDIFWPGFYGQFEENIGLGFSDIGIPYGLRHKTEIKMLKEMLRLMKSGVKKLKAIQGKNKELLTVLNLCEYIACCVQTGINAKLFYEQRVALKLCENPAKMLEICKKIRKIANDEIKNAEYSLRFVKKDSSIGFEASMLYVGGVDRVNWKIKQVNSMINGELNYYERETKKHIERIKTL